MTNGPTAPSADIVDAATIAPGTIAPGTIAPGTIAPGTVESVLGALRFDAAGLIPAIAQQHDTGEVLMMAWMNADAVRETLETGRVCYWSRSRGALWRKGESSGHVQRLVELRFDCDADTLLLLVDQTGPACHTNRPNCFYNAVEPGGVRVLTDPMADPMADPRTDPTGPTEGPGPGSGAGTPTR